MKRKELLTQQQSLRRALATPNAPTGPRSPVTSADLRIQAAQDLRAVASGYEVAETAILEIQKLLVNASFNADSTSGRTASQEVATLTKALKDAMSVLVGARAEARTTLDSLQSVDPPVPSAEDVAESVQPLPNFSPSENVSDVVKGPTRG